MLVTGVLAGLLEAKSTGKGRVVDAAMTDGSALLMSLFQALGARSLWSEARGANLLDGGAPFYRCYTCRDGRFVAVVALEPQFYAALIAGLGLTPDAAPQFDMSGWPALHARFEGIFATRDRNEWEKHFEGTDACVTPVLTKAEAARHPHNIARGTFVEQVVVQAAPAPRFQGTPAEPVLQPAPMSLDEARRRWA